MQLSRKNLQNERPRWKANLSLIIILITVIILGTTFWATNNYLWRFPAQSKTAGFRAVFIDELSLTYPDQSLVTNTTQALLAHGYTVDYIAPSPSAVSTFRELPSQGYDLIIIRAHTASHQAIITTEEYRQNAYTGDQISHSLVPAQVSDGPEYFALTPQFVRQDMTGMFQGSTIVVTGCSALEGGTQDMARAFLDKGAQFFVGWDNSVTIIHDDNQIGVLISSLAQGKTVPQAVNQAGTPDPVYNGRLKYLDWNTLVNVRWNNFVSAAILWLGIGSVLVVGPFSVFLAPKFLGKLEEMRDAHWRKRSVRTKRR
jgi:hypothetical protein